MAAEDAKDDDQDEPKKKKKKKSSGNLLQMIILVLLLVVLALGGFIAWKLVKMKVPLLSSQTQAVSAHTAPKPGIFIPMDNITVNLADTDQSRFLRVKMKLEVQGKDAEKQIKANSAQIKDLVITILSSKTFNDVRTPQGKFALKEELAYRINQLVGGHPVEDVYFTDFVAQ